MPKKLLALVVLAIIACGAQAADKVKVGFVCTLSGPRGAPGIDIRDGFNLALEAAMAASSAACRPRC